MGKDPNSGKRSEAGGIRVGLDLGGTKMYSAVFGESWKILGSARKPTEGHRGAEAGVERMVEVVLEALGEAGVDVKDVKAIGVGCPGVVDMKAGVLRSTPNLGWPDIKLEEVMGKRLGCRVGVFNDVDAGTFGEYVAGAGTGARSVLGVFPGTGVGAGFVYDGKLLRGRKYSAMEIGRMRWPAPGLGKPDGEWPNFESFCSRLAVASAAAAEGFRGNAPALMKKSGTDISRIKSKALAASYEAGDEGTVRVIENALDYLCAGIGGVINLLGPDRVVLGGGLVEAMPKLFVNRVADGLVHYAADELLEDLWVKEAELGDDAAVLGAAALAGR